MALSAFGDKSSTPDGAALATTLGRTAALWSTLKERLSSEFGDLSEEWCFAGKSYGWSLRLKQKKRAIVYLSPRQKHFVAAFALGEKACRAALAAGLDTAILALIDAAPRYPEGRGVQIPVRKQSDLDQVILVARVKMAN